MINNPLKYRTALTVEQKLEIALNEIYKLILEDELQVSDIYELTYISTIKDNITNIHSFYTNRLRDDAIADKKYNINI